MSDIKLRVENLTKTFGDEVAVDDVSMTITDGETRSLLGPSGCGKTTTLRCIAGLETPDSGQIYIDDQLVSDPDQNISVAPARRKIGMVFQSYAIWPHMTVNENVQFPLDERGVGDKAERKERVQEILEVVGLEQYGHNLATNLSGGQKQRVSLSRALVAEPEILLLDEPLSNLDVKLREQMRQEIRNICDEFGITVLYVTHAQDEALFLSDEMSLMLDGEIVEEGPPDSLYEDPDTFFGMQFLGECNTIPGAITSSDGDHVTVDTELGNLVGVSKLPDGADESDVQVCFRPKRIELLEDPSATTGGTDGTTILDGEVAQKSITTDFYGYHVRINGSEVLIHSLENLDIEVGESVKVSFPYEGIRVYSSTASVPTPVADPTVGVESAPELSG